MIALCAALVLPACATTKPAPDTAPPATTPETSAPAATTPAATPAEPVAVSPDGPTSRYAGKDMRCAQVQECHQKLGDPPSDAIWACDAGTCQARANNPKP